MATPFMPQAIDGPPAVPPAYGLLVAADTLTDANGGEWQKGVTWSPEQIGGGGAVAMDCNGGTDTLDQDDNPDVGVAEPFVVWAEDHCSTFGWRHREYEARARRQLDATQSFSIAREFQLGAIRTADSLVNVALKDAVVVHPGHNNIRLAVGVLEGALAEKFKGRRGMIHVTPQTLDHMHAEYLLERAGNKWMTAQGTVVVSDAGYTTEADNFLYAYATGPVIVRLGAVVLNPGALDDAMRVSAAGGVNAVTVYAEREVLVQVDAIDQGPAVDAMFKVQLDIDAWGTVS